MNASTMLRHHVRLIDCGTPLSFGRSIKPTVYVHAEHSQCMHYNYLKNEQRSRDAAAKK